MEKISGNGVFSEMENHFKFEFMDGRQTMKLLAAS
jgi:hypothetical protein